MLVEVVLDGRVISSRTIPSDTGKAVDPLLLKRLALQAALAAGELRLSDAFRVSFRITEIDGPKRG